MLYKFLRRFRIRVFCGNSSGSEFIYLLINLDLQLFLSSALVIWRFKSIFIENNVSYFLEMNEIIPNTSNTILKI